MTGHIERRGKRSWRVKFDAGTDPATGKRVTRRLAIKGTKREAERKLTELLAQRDSGALISAHKVLLRDYLEQWVGADGWCSANVAPKTRERYDEVIRCQVLPHLGNLKLQDLKPAHVGKWHANLLVNGRKSGGPLSGRTVGHAHRVLHKALECAVEDELISRNPVGVKKPPKVERIAVQILAPEEIAIVLNAFRGRALYSFVLLALATGARRGELLALRWDDLDLDQCTVRLWRSLEETRAGLRVKETKTSAGHRVIGIPTAVAADLRAHRKAQLELRLQLGQGRMPDGALVFPTWEGKARSPRATSLPV